MPNIKPILICVIIARYCVMYLQVLLCFDKERAGKYAIVDMQDYEKTQATPAL